MTKKRPLNAEELAIAERLKSIIARNPDLTEEAVGAKLGVSQGQISHWTGGRLPVPAIRAAALAKELGIADPGEISIAWRKINATSLVRDPPAYYEVPGDPADLRAEIEALKATLAIMIAVATQHRPIEGGDLARRLRKHVPARLLQHGFVHEVLQTLDSAARDRTARRPTQAGTTNR